MREAKIYLNKLHEKEVVEIDIRENENEKFELMTAFYLDKICEKENMINFLEQIDSLKRNKYKININLS